MSSPNDSQNDSISNNKIKATSTTTTATTGGTTANDLYYEVTSHINHATNQALPQLQKQFNDAVSIPLVKNIRTTLYNTYNDLMHQSSSTTTSPSSPIYQSKQYLQRVRSDVFNTLQDVRENYDPRQVILVPSVAVGLLTMISTAINKRPNKSYAIVRNTLLTAGITSFILYPQTTLERTQLYISKIDRAVHEYLHHQPVSEIQRYQSQQRLPCGCDKYSLQPVNTPLMKNSNGSSRQRIHFIDDTSSTSSTDNQLATPALKPTLRPHTENSHLRGALATKQDAADVTAYVTKETKPAA